MAEVQFRFRDDEQVADPAVTVDAFGAQTNAAAVRIEPGDDARDLLPFLDRLKLVEVNFPSFTDGRGYSSARILREAGYTGELRAVGAVFTDQLSHLRRCGFDAFAPQTPIDAAEAETAFNVWPDVYQPTTDGRRRSGPSATELLRMPDAARPVDRIDTGPRFTEADAVRLNRMFKGTDTFDMLASVLQNSLAGDIAVVSSFGAESAVLLHLVSQIDPDLPVLFLETGKHFPETLAYRDLLIERLGLKSLRNLMPDPAELAKKDESGLRWSYDPDGCCEIRKVQPLARALTGYDASITGRKGFSPAPAPGCRASRSTRLTPRAASRSTRWPTGHRNASPSTSSSMICHHTLWWNRVILRSAARPAPARLQRARMRVRAAGKAGTRPNAVFMCQVR